MSLRVIYGILLALHSVNSSPTGSGSLKSDFASPIGLNEGHDNAAPRDYPVTNFSTPDGIIPEYDTELRKRGFGLLRQYNAIPEMKFLSQPPGTDVENLEDYVYLDYAGSNITVYVHDSGIYLKHEQFTLPRPPSVTAGKIEWLYPIRHGLKKFQKKKGQPTTDPTGHGTCVTSKIVGLTRGAAIGANVKMVPRINKKDDDWMLGGLEAIVKDIQKQKKALNGHFFPVVSLSYGYIWKKDKVHAKYRSFYKQMVDLGALLVVTAGNDRRNHANVTSYPALFAKEPDFEDRWPIGQNLGTRNHFMRLAKGPDEYTRKEGTSFAGPTVAGVAAYLLSAYRELREPGQSGKLVAARLIKNAYVRMNLPGGMPSVWNEEYGDREFSC